jgi:hypothetical protein
MAGCGSRRGSKKRTCIGQRDKEITIKVPYITAPGDVDYDRVFADKITVFARIQTTTGKTVFDDVSGRDIPLTHIFDIPYLDNIELTSEDFIEYLGNNYKIISVENVDERNVDWIIRASFKGPANLEANKA